MVSYLRSRLQPSEGFCCSDFSSLSSLIEQYDIAQWQHCVAPFAGRLQLIVRRKQAAFEKLRASFLGTRPVDADLATPWADFYVQSRKKDLAAVARRFVLGIQARGLHLNLEDTMSIEAHAEVASTVTHPYAAAMEAIPHQWSYVFAQIRAAMKKSDFPSMCSQLNSYRRNFMSWVRELAIELQPLQREMRATMPPSAELVAGQVHFPLFYTLLSLTNYPNPDFAFRFLVGAPLVGSFSSPALPSRHSVKGELTDARIFQLADECRRKEKYVISKLDKEAAIKSMSKFRKELLTRTIVADFPDRDSLRAAIIADVRQAWGLSDFYISDDQLIVSTQFSVIESHAYAEEVEGKLQFKIRNIFNGRILNGLASGYSTYIPHTHADIAAILSHWGRLFGEFLTEALLPSFLGWPADFAAAYRQMPLAAIHVAFSGFVYFDYDVGERRFGFYRALPFGSALAPAEWSESCTALAHVAAILLLAIITHCIDDVCQVEMQQTVASAREAFIELVELLGLRLDPDKSLAPMAEFVYLGLKMTLPAAIPRKLLAFRCPGFRRRRLIEHIERIIDRNSLTPSEASSMRGRLFYYCYWHQEARSYLVYLARRQYATGPGLPGGKSSGVRSHFPKSGSHLDAEEMSHNSAWPLTEELHFALIFFLSLIRSETFKKGIEPQRYLNRLKAIVYTDGSRSDAERGIGGVFFGSHLQTCFFAEDLQDDEFYPHIAVVEMRAILRALRLFGEQLHGRAIIFFVDNTHALGCLLKRSSSLECESPGCDFGTGGTAFHPGNSAVTGAAIHHGYGIRPHVDFERLSESIKASMNSLARDIWNLVTHFDLLVWWEYVNTHSNAADPPSRGFLPHCSGCRLGDNTKELKSYQEFCIGKKVEEAKRLAASLGSH